jgi:hypothetical protein
VKYRLSSQEVEPGTSCSGGRGECLNAAVVAVVTASSRRAKPVELKRSFCKRCLVTWLAGRVLRSFDPPRWVLDLFVLPNERRKEVTREEEPVLHR